MRTINGVELDTFTEHYLIAALWSSHDETDESGGKPMDATYSLSDFDPDFLRRMVRDCERFQRENAADITPENYSGSWDITEHAGHDFWLTRNHHGAGFWDGDWEDEAGARLTEAAQRFRECNLYVTDTGTIDGYPFGVSGEPVQSSTTSEN